MGRSNWFICIYRWWKMTHDELLVLLDEVITDDVHHLATQTAQALRAVVELHEPYEDWCSECSLSVVQIPYPCRTIQTIEKELE
jgi:hypothetical protein